MLRALQPIVSLEPQLTLDAVLDFQRWMAPEVCLCVPYGLKADVYSFGLFFYYLLAMKLPFGDIKQDWHMKRVVKGGVRPTIPHHLPAFLRDTVKACWSPKPSDRPSFAHLCSLFPEGIESIVISKHRRSILDRSGHLLDKSMHSANAS
jgi:serine/threonine protein kinase